MEAQKQNQEKSKTGLKALSDERRRANVVEVASRSSRSPVLRHRTDRLLQGLSVLVANPELVSDLRPKSAFHRVGFDVFDHLDFRPSEIPDQLAGFVRRRVALARSLDQFAALLGLSAQRDEFLRAGIAFR